MSLKTHWTIWKAFLLHDICKNVITLWHAQVVYATKDEMRLQQIATAKIYME
jgi:hypothetical protein